MAIELCSENSILGVSPRISFSHDLSQNDVIPIEQHNPSLKYSSSTIDFDFHVRESFYHDSSSADELFSDGKILPVEIKKKAVTLKSDTMLTNQSANGVVQDVTDDKKSKKESSKENKIMGSSEGDEIKQSSKSFWRFKRSTSLNCGSGYGRSLCPLPLLSRSNSTGSTAPNVKRSSSSSLAKDGHHHHKQQHYSQKHSSLNASVKSTQSSASMSYQKPPLKKNYGSYGNGAHISPVLHVPSASMFGFGSIFANGKDKNKKK